MQPKVNPNKIEKIIIIYNGYSKKLNFLKFKKSGNKLRTTMCELSTPNHMKRTIRITLKANLNIQINKHTLLI